MLCERYNRNDTKNNPMDLTTVKEKKKAQKSIAKETDKDTRIMKISVWKAVCENRAEWRKIIHTAKTNKNCEHWRRRGVLHLNKQNFIRTIVSRNQQIARFVDDDNDDTSCKRKKQLLLWTHATLVTNITNPGRWFVYANLCKEILVDFLLSTLAWLSQVRTIPDTIISLSRSKHTNKTLS